jgi:dolichol kinase
MDWIAAVLSITSSELLTRKLWQGWVVSLIAQGAWYYIGITNRLWGCVALTTIFVFMASRGLVRWRRDDNRIHNVRHR